MAITRRPTMTYTLEEARELLKQPVSPEELAQRREALKNSDRYLKEMKPIIGEDVTVGHCVCMEDCMIENGALIGSNAVVLNGAHIGQRSLIAAGSVVTTNAHVPAEVVAAGAPASVKKKLEGPAVAWIDQASAEYVHLSRSYLHHGIGDPEVHELAEAKEV